MDQLYPFYLDRLWTAGLFALGGLCAGLLALLAYQRQNRTGPGAIVAAIPVFALWEVLLLFALLAQLSSERSDPWTVVLLVFALVVVPFGLALTLLVTARTWLVAPACGLLALGALAAPAGDLGHWLATVALLGLFALLTLLVFNGYWRAWLGYLAGGVVLLTLGGLTAASAGASLSTFARGVFTELEGGHLGIAEPWWLVLLILIPLIGLLSFRSLAGLGPVRRWVAIGVRCLLILFLTLALAEVHLRYSSESVTVLFLWDRSLSIPPEYAPDDRARATDLREQRIFRFINDSVALRGSQRQKDSVGLIAFGRWPLLELPPASVPKLGIHKLQSDIDDTYTDLASAMKLALASFPETGGKRIVLLSDGNENLGKAEEQARIARQNGVEIDIVPIAGGRRNLDEVLIERVEAPTITEQQARVPIRVLIRSFNPNIVVGKLRLIRTSMEVKKGGKEGASDQVRVRTDPVLPRDAQVKLRPGLNAFYFQEPVSDLLAYTYKAQFIPDHVENARGDVLKKTLAGDRPENNEASAAVVSRGQRTVLLVEQKPGEHQLLVDWLHRTKGGLRVLTLDALQLPQDPAELTQFLSRFDALILANLPAESLTEQQQKVIRSNVHDQGLGMVMIGGRQSYGAGGWQGTEVEKALPVTCDLRSMEVEGKSGLVLIMHASEIAEGNMWQKKIAQLAIDRLSPVDMMGVTHYDWNGPNHKWHIPFQQIGNQRVALKRMLDTLNPGDMPDAEPSLKMAYDELTDPKYNLGTKHIIFISDGDHWSPPIAILKKIKAAAITCTTVCVTSHGQAEVARMKQVAAMTGGRSYYVTDPKQLPAIYIKETRLISKAFVHNEKFDPNLREAAGPTKGLALDEKLPPLHGFVRTTPRPGPLVHVPIDKLEKKETYPILAHWHYGLGKVLAYTSDARSPDKTAWDTEWANSGMYARFWEQAVEWSLRAVESGKNLTVQTDVRDGKVLVTVAARDEKQLPLTDLELRGGVTSPSLKVTESGQPTLKFTQKSPGVYEAEVKADEVGSYFLHVQGFKKKQIRDKDGKPQTVEEAVDSVRAGVTIPYSPEFAEMESNVGLLERLRELTSGNRYEDDDGSLGAAASLGDIFRPTQTRTRSLQSIWMWLVALTAVGLFFDIAARRITVDPHKLTRAAQDSWARLQGQEPVKKSDFLERLQSRKAQVGEEVVKEKSTRRFEAGAAPTIAPPPEFSETAPPQPTSPPAAPRRIAPESEKEPGDYASRLLRAKKRAMEEREQDREQGGP